MTEAGARRARRGDHPSGSGRRNGAPVNYKRVASRNVEGDSVTVGLRSNLDPENLIIAARQRR